MISIIIPTLNEERAIGKTLGSLRSLTLTHEIIISDGKSTDRTVEIAKSFGVTVLEYKGEKRQTISEGRNAGGSAAAGDYLVFFDADCVVMDPDAFFTRAVSLFEKNKKLVALNATLKVLPEMETLGDKIVFGAVNLLFRLMNNTMHKGASSGEFQMMTKAAFMQVKGFREDLVTREDGDMFERLSKIGETYCDKELTVFHTGRRAHKIGWAKLLSIWTVNTISVALFDKAASKEWTPIR